MKHRSSSSKSEDDVSLDETKLHVLRAAQELFFAAKGVLSFCKNYVETNQKESHNPHLAQFFSKALAVVGDLGGELTSGTEVHKITERFLHPVLRRVEREMAEDRPLPKKNHRKKEPRGGKRVARARSRKA